MDFERAKQFALNSLHHELAQHHYYHNLSHTLDVCNSIVVIAKEEGVSHEELMLLKTAGYFHDLGFIKQYANNEPIAVRIAQEKLPEFGYKDKHIEIIEGLILATKIPQKPVNHLEEIICDADLDYLGRDDFYEKSQCLFKEWQTFGLVETEEEFNSLQVSFFEAHHYFTETANNKRKALKNLHLTELKKTLIQ